MESEKKIVSEKTYTIKIKQYDNNTIDILDTNDGFNAFELLGIVNYVREKIKSDLIK